MFQVNENVRRVLLGVYAGSPELLKERTEIIQYYSFYNGEAKDDKQNPFTMGQSWEVPEGLDYEPTQEIRNHTKKLLQKQQRFMFGQSPTVMVKPYDNESTDAAETKRQFIDDILDGGEFWNETFKAFLDCTIGKRVLLLVDANPGEEIQYKYYTADQFTYKTNKHDYKKLEEVIIAYQDADTVDKPADEQIWHRWKYAIEDFEGSTCILEIGEFDGNGKEIEGTHQVIDTKLKELPARVILNGGLLGDTNGTSDVEDLMSIANSYNKRMSDFADSLRFKMFEQPVITNASASSVESIKVAPNALIDLKADPTQQGAKPEAYMLSSTFSFKDAAEYYLDKALADMYELMDQPRPEDIKNVPSAKAIRFIFYDLMARCEEKWKSWEPVILWAINFSLEVTEQFNLYTDNDNRKSLGTKARVSLTHNYPIPEDEELKKKLAMQEVETQVKSRKTYMREFGDIEDENKEFNEILEEAKALQEAERDSFETVLGNTNPADEIK